MTEMNTSREKQMKDLNPMHRLALVVAGLAILLSTATHAAESVMEWDAPTQNTDGTPITNQLAYIFTYGLASGARDTSIDVGAPKTLTLTGLVDGQIYYGAVKASSDIGEESDFSEELSWTAPDQTPPTITAPGTVAVTGDESDQAAIPDLTQAITVNDNLSSAANITITQAPASGTTVGLGDTSVTVTTVDEAGNAANAVIVVAVSPMYRPPRPLPPSNLHVQFTP